MSHKPEFITEMKQRLAEEREQVQRDLAHLAHKEEGDFKANFPEYERDDEENAMEVADYEAQSATTEALEARLKEVAAALRRIEEGTYGVTKEGIQIPEERLRANPAATTLASK